MSVRPDPVASDPVASMRDLASGAARQAATLVAMPEIGARWDEPSALDDMTVGALAAHLIRATGATVAYLDRTDPSAVAGDELLTKYTYFHAALDAPIHDQIKTVSAREAEVGPAELAAKASDVADALVARLDAEPADRLVGALGNRMLTLDDFCATRLIEILMHIDDLAVSADLPRPDIDEAATSVVIDILTGIARHKHGDWEVIYALGRAERSTTDVYPVF